MQPRIKNKSKLEWTIPDCSPNEVLHLWLIDTVCHLLVKKKKWGGGGEETWGLLTFFLENNRWIVNSKGWGQREEGRCLIPRIVPVACLWEVCWELEGLSLWIEGAMRFKKLHMFFQSFMKYPICRDLSASSMLPDSQNVVSNLPKRHPWQGAQMPHHCLGFAVGGWQSWNDSITCH